MTPHQSSSRPLARALPRRRFDVQRLYVRLADGAATTLHVASYDLDAVDVRVAALDTPAPLARWCEEQDVRHAVVGGFFVRRDGTALGELRVDGSPRPSVPFDAPWADLRASVNVAGATVRIARRDELAAEPAGDLLQAGPLLVADGRRAIEDGVDSEGFTAAAHQFDSDITVGRYPRAALALAGDRVL